MRHLVLGSQSIFRKAMLSQFTLQFEHAVSSFNEEEVPFNGDPVDYVNTLSNGKSALLVPRFPHSIILTADTVVYYGGRVYNKPQSLEEAISFLTDFAGQWQSVITSVTVHANGHAYTQHEETRVLFNPLTIKQIHQYVSHVNWHDKAGGYSVQGVGTLLVSRYEGSIDNVAGLPLNTVRELLLKTGIDLWNHFK